MDAQQPAAELDRIDYLNKRHISSALPSEIRRAGLPVSGSPSASQWNPLPTINPSSTGDSVRQSYRDDAEAPAGLLFPVLGSRAGGVSTRSGSSIPTKAASLDLQELDRHQRSANGKPFFSPGLGDYGERLRGPTGAAALDLQELERHQRSASGTADPGVGFYGTRLGGPMGDGQQAQDGLATRALAAAKDERLSHDIKGNTHPRPIADDDTSFSSLLNDMPTDADGPTKHVMWTELVRLKTRTLELKIAEAKQKEKEAELELARLKAGTEHKIELVHAAPVKQVEVSTGFAQTDVGPSKRPIPELATAFANHPLISQAMAPEEVLQQVPHATHNHPSGDEGLSHEASQTPMTQFDLEAMMQNSYMDSLFSWLPEFGETSQVDPYQPTAVAPADLHTSISKTGPLSFQSPYQLPDSQPLVIASHPLPTAKKHRAPSAASSSSSPAPTKKTKRSGEKRVVVEHNSTCLTCRKPIARILIRAPKSRIPDNTSVEFNCGDCQSAARPAIVPDPAAVSSAIGTVDIRKRVRAQAEFEDEDVEADMKRMFCDVCQRVVGYGQVVGGKEKQGMGHMAEIICASCDSKYQRCTDCGGGGGSRNSVGKWRMKQVFQAGRKTCSLSHSRLGDRPREIGVHVTPTDFTPQQLKEVLTRCKGVWSEKTLSRLAVPEMLEIDLPPDVMNPLRHYGDVEDIVTRNWPTREAMIRAEGADPSRFRRLLGLTWAHAKPRRTVRTVDLEEEYAKAAEAGDDGDMSTVLANVKRTNVVIPAGSELVGMWGGEWDMQHGSLLISTLIPFEGTDGEDTTALSVGEMITKIQSLKQSLNAEREASALQQGKKPELLPQCEHLWVVSGGAMPLVRERMADILVRKRSFVHVDEYLTRHPDFIHALQARPVGLHPDLHRPLHGEQGASLKPLVLVRWLGKNFDPQKILEIKQQEFGGKSKLRRMPKSQV